MLVKYLMEEACLPHKMNKGKGISVIPPAFIWHIYSWALGQQWNG